MTVMGLRRRLCDYREPSYYVGLRVICCALAAANGSMLFRLRKESVELELMILMVEETA